MTKTSVKTGGVEPGQPACPLRLDMQSFRYHERGLLQAMRSLRRDLNRCRRCARQLDCAVMSEYNAIVAQAIQEITDEFNYV